METVAIVPRNLVKTDPTSAQKEPNKTSLNGNYVILIAVALFCGLLFFLGFPIWAILCFGMGMITILLLLYALQGIPLDIKLDTKELEEGIYQDLFP